MSEIEKPDTPSSVLALFETSKEGIQTFSRSIIQQVKDGYADPLRIRVVLKTIELISYQIKEGIKAEAEREADKYGDREREAFGAKIQNGVTSTKYDYASTGDPEWVELSERLKSRETFLKALDKPITVAIEATGEMVTITPPQKKQTYGLKISIQ